MSQYNVRVGSLVKFKKYCYYGALAYKVGLIVSHKNMIYGILVEEKTYEVFGEEFETI